MTLIKIAQLIIAVLLIVAILLQNKHGGLGGAFGGSGGGSANYMTKRGFEKKLYIATVVLAVLFFLISLSSVII